MPVCVDAYKEIESYDYPNEAYKSLFDAIRVMHEKYTAISRPDFDGFYGKTNTLYDGLRAMQGDLADRCDAGEDAGTLAEETWEFFKTIK